MLSQAFDTKLRLRNLVSLRVAAVLTLILVPLFWVLDWFVIPDYVVVTFLMRLACTINGAVILIVSFGVPDWTKRHVDRLSGILCGAVSWSIAVMCWLQSGYASPYYAGLNFVTIAAGIIFLWEFKTVCIFHMATYGFYIAPLLLGFLKIDDVSTTMSNQFFLIATSIITIASQRLRLNLEKREFESSEAQSHLLKEVQELATTDWLTGLNNRRQLFALGEREIQRAQRYRRTLCAIMLDIDKFKNVNDTYGHAVGDEVIRTVAERIRANSRREDIHGRYGGEEFAMLLPETDIQEAHQKVAERIRLSFQDKPIPTAAGPLNITVSVGVAVWAPEMHSLLDLLSRADQALYAAKKRGRNQVITWNTEIPNKAS